MWVDSRIWTSGLPSPIVHRVMRAEKTMRAEEAVNADITVRAYSYSHRALSDEGRSTRALVPDLMVT
jgi:hypothetical protein